MQTCKTCKHWDIENKASEFTHQISDEDAHKACSHYKLDMCDDSDGLYLNNDGHWWLTTGPDFGCIHHAKRQ